ncbi:MAG: hypothetical protein II975_07260 [Bacteroidales bacterium]|nr:hypothetical protein [Bacteroidales bacterium]
MNRKVFFTVLFVLSTMLAAAQTDFGSGWKEVKKLYNDEDYTKAYTKASQLFGEAKRLGDSRNTLIGALELSRIASQYQEDAADSALTRYLSVVDRLDAVDAAVCHAFLANFYSDYRASHRWLIARNSDTDEAGLDYKLWPDERFDREIKKHITEALKEEQVLKSTNVQDVKMFCDDNYSSGILVTPTLYDVVMNLAVDGTSDYAEKMQLLDKRIDFHKDDSDCLRIWLDYRKLDLLADAPNVPSPTEKDYERYADKYKGTDCDILTMFYYRAASLLTRKKRFVEAVAMCNKAIALFPESKGGKECANLINEIRHPRCSVKMVHDEMNDHDMLAKATSRNADTLYFRIIKKCNHRGIYALNDVVKHMAKQKVLKEWSMALEHRDDYQEQTNYVYLPSMPAGEYDLLVSTSQDFKANGLSYGEFTCCDARIVRALPYNALRGYVILRSSGAPVAGQKMILKCYDYKKGKYVATGLTAVTDATGYYEFDDNPVPESHDLYVTTEYNGVTIKYDAERYYKSESYEKVKLYCQMDRPVYKLGETVSFAYVVHNGDAHTSERVCSGMELFVTLKDVNDKVVDSVRLTTDEFGVCHGELKVPSDALPGRFKIYTTFKEGDNSRYDIDYVNVEEYKQPKFTVKMYGDNDRHSFGKELTVSGLAASYSQVPIDGASVTYTVTRREMYRPWRWWFTPAPKATVVAYGETATDADGKFDMRFTPMPDSSVELSTKPCFVYTVSADVTDLNGETHSQIYSLRVGYENSYILLSQGGEVSKFDTIEVEYNNLDGNPIDGVVTLTVERLKQPSKPHLSHSLLDGNAKHSLSRNEFEKRFGLLAYEPADIDADQWPVDRKITTKTLKLTKEGGAEAALGKMEPGIYRITATTTDSEGNKVESKATYTYMPHNGKAVQTQDLVWISEEESTLSVGDTFRLRIGSRYKDVHVLYVLSKAGSVLDRKVISLNGDIKTIELPIVEDYKGDVHIDLLAMKENVMWKKSVGVYVPLVEKELDVTIESFRNKLRPGDNETWTVKVTPRKRENAVGSLNANVIMTMYDAALNTYGSLTASLSPWSRNYNPSMLSYLEESFYMEDYQTEPKHEYVGDIKINFWHFINGVFYYNSRNMLYRKNSHIQSARVRGEEGMVEAMVGGVAMEKDSYVQEEPMDMSEVSVMGTAESGQRISSEEVEEAVLSAGEDEPQEEETVRTNLNTLAFFKPALRTDDNGTLTCSFTVPELLTEWSIRGVAHTKDMMTGSLTKSLITQKELMVQPNVPRFLRQGDTVDFLAKVVNMTAEPQTVTVTFELTDAATGLPIKLSSNQTVVSLPAKRSESVSFRIAVPGDLYLANYRIVAKSAKFSDGEQDCIPVLSNRQMVTVSQAMYINGKGEKSYELPLAQSSIQAIKQSGNQALKQSHQPHLLKVEFTSNPIWYAVQALPYVQDLDNPSNIFLFNRLYTNSLAFSIVKDNPSIETVFKQWIKDTINPLMSQLEKNEDVKQTVLDETPWLRDGKAETQQMHRIAEYFDQTKLSSDLKRCEKKLFDQQRTDGGWSWMPDGRQSSLYTTQYLLEGFGKLALWSQTNTFTHSHIQALKKALHYVDEETYDFYRRYLKHTDFEALNIDYLYMRSFYTADDYKIKESKHKEAYNYFYRNTLKHYKEYKSLHTRAQLALVFHRCGNRTEALDIIRRIKESALHSDEMGMYWRDNTASWWWYERPIETQALIIQAFSEITPDDKESIGQMQQWLLKQKQTTRWDTDISTVEAVNALISSSNATSIKLDTIPCRVTVAGQPLNSPAQAGTGYQSQSWFGDEISKLFSSTNKLTQSQTNAITITKLTDGIAWGAAYYQFLDDMDKIERNEMGVKLQKTLYKVKTDGTLEAILNPVKLKLKVGDRVRIRILFDCDRNLEYVELKDGRPACFESVSSASGWHWNSGLSYYASVLNASNNFYIDRLDKGKYILEYDIFVTNTGSFTLPATTIQCLYAPEFRANGNGGKLTIAR